MLWFALLGVAFIAGIALPTQFAVNAQLRGVVGGPVLAAAVSFMVGSVILVAATALVERSLPPASAVAGAPWWVWTGGLLGAGFVLCSIVLIPRLGAGATVGFFLAGQITASVVIDHFGLLGTEVQQATVLRILGVALVFAGVFLVQRF